jgi:hypothetical protein
MTELSAAEKRALAARTNAFQELGKIVNLALNSSLGLVETPEGFFQQGGKIMIPAAPVAVHQTIRQLQHRLEQMEISLGVLVEILLEEEHVCAVRDERAASGQNAPPALGPSKLDRAEFFNRVAQAAERHAESIRRQMLSAGAQAVPPEANRILRPS